MLFSFRIKKKIILLVFGTFRIVRRVVVAVSSNLDDGRNDKA